MTPISEIQPERILPNPKIQSRMNFEAFQDAPWFDSSFRVTIGGLGNIGSWTSLLLARMGYELYLYDYDTVEYRNIGSQFYNSLDVGKRKDVAMQTHIQHLTGNRKNKTAPAAPEE